MTRLYPHDRLGALLAGRLDNASPEEKHLALTQYGREIVDEVLRSHMRDDWETSPLHALLQREQLTFTGAQGEDDKRLRLVAAYNTNITSLVVLHHKWRHEHDGNVVWEFTGPTGTGKSSCMLGLLERFNRVDPAKLDRHLTIDVGTLPRILPRLKSGEGLVIDEQSALVGEGSLTQEKILRNIEDQIRASGIDLYWASPKKDEKRHATSQGEFEAILLNRRKRAARFLVWLEETPLGYCNLPWAGGAMWQAYLPMKRANVRRATAAQFNQPGALDEELKQLFEDPVLHRLCQRKRLKPQDWRDWIKRHATTTLNTTQTANLAEDCYRILEMLQHDKRDVQDYYGWPATPGMEKCVKPLGAD